MNTKIEKEKRNRPILVYSLSLFIILAIAGAGSAATVSVSPQTQNVAAGGTFTFTVNIDSGTTNMQYAYVELNYDATQLAANSVTSGNLLGADALTEPGSGTGTPGKVIYGLARTSGAAAPVNGTFITVQFTAMNSASGIYSLDLDNVSLMDTTTTTIANPTVNDGQVNVSGTPGASTPTPTPTPHQLRHQHPHQVLEEPQYSCLLQHR